MQLDGVADVFIDASRLADFFAAVDDTVPNRIDPMSADFLQDELDRLLVGLAGSTGAKAFASAFEDDFFVVAEERVLCA